jgi:hypothetical protein
MAAPHPCPEGVVSMAGEIHPNSVLGGIAKILAELDALNAEVEATLTPPADITDDQGRVWTWWKGDLYRHGVSAVPKSMIRTN